MNWKSKILGLVSVAALGLSLAGGVSASDTEQSIDISVDVNPGTQFSVSGLHAGNFSAVNFSTTAQSGSNTSLFYTVTDLRGTGVGWTLTLAAPGGFDGATTGLNLTYDPYTNQPSLRGTSNCITGYSWCYLDVAPNTPAFSTQGISQGGNWADAIAGMTALSAAGGFDGLKPQGVGIFTHFTALYFNSPGLLPADTWTTTVELTLASNQP